MIHLLYSNSSIGARTKIVWKNYCLFLRCWFLIIIFFHNEHGFGFDKNATNALLEHTKIMNIVTATRLHLGTSKAPPDRLELKSKLENFTRFSQDVVGATHALVAVDANDDKIPNYSLVKEVQSIVDENRDKLFPSFHVQVLPVTPWGRFIPALNALLVAAAAKLPKSCDWICFVSAETTASKEAIHMLKQHLASDTLMVGARLPGHDYRGPKQSGDNRAVTTELNGLTCPWNTLAIWNLPKICLTGFQLVSDGLLTDSEQEPSYGIEEVVASALLQRLLGADQAKVKLVNLPSVNWNVNFDDPERQKWQEMKMQSKLIRSQRQLDLIRLKGEVHHC